MLYYTLHCTVWVRAEKTESSSTFGVVAIVVDCCVRSVELLCIVTVCYIKWTMACMSPAPINTCDIWCETCISWFHFCVSVCRIFVCSFGFLLSSIFAIKTTTTSNGSHKCAHPLSQPNSWLVQSVHTAHCQCQNIVFTIKQKDDCLSVCCAVCFMWLMKIDNISMAYNYNWLILSSGESREEPYKKQYTHHV